MSALGWTLIVLAMARRPLEPAKPEGRSPLAAHRHPRNGFAFACDPIAGIVEACNDQCKHGPRVQAHAIAHEPSRCPAAREGSTSRPRTRSSSAKCWRWPAGRESPTEVRRDGWGPASLLLQRTLVPLAEDVNGIGVRGVPAADERTARRALLAIIANLAHDERPSGGAPAASSISTREAWR